jgi:YVTN family beta-propeller protein
VVNNGGNSVPVISDSTNSVVQTILGFQQPQGAEYDQGTGQVYVTNDNVAGVVNDSTDKVTGEIPLQQMPFGAAYDPAQSEMLVTEAQAGNLAIIPDNDTGSVSYVNVGYYPYYVAFDSGTDSAYVSNDGSGTVSVVPLGAQQPATTSTSSSSTTSSKATTPTSTLATSSKAATSSTTQAPLATTQASPPAAKGTSGIPEFPYQLGVSVLAAVAMAAAYVLARRSGRNRLP